MTQALCSHDGEIAINPAFVTSIYKRNGTNKNRPFEIFSSVGGPGPTGHVLIRSFETREARDKEFQILKGWLWQ